MSAFEEDFLTFSCAADAHTSNWNEVRASLVVEVLRRPADSSQLAPRRLLGEVRGESMLPTLWPGDVVAIEPCVPQELRAGEIVLAIWGSNLVLHRLMGPYSAEGFLLRGDCVAAFDPPYPPDALLAKAVGVMKGERTVSRSSLHPGVGARLAQLVGWLLSHWSFARRIVMRLHGAFQSFRRTERGELAADFVVRGAR